MALRSLLCSRQPLSKFLLKHDPLRNPKLKTEYLSNPLGRTPLPLTLRCYSHAVNPKTKNSIQDAATVDINRFKSSKDPEEVAKFAGMAETWWHPEGPLKPVHAMNPTRVSFICSTLCRHFRKDPNSPRPLEGLKIIDVGCGGGILSEPLAQLGAIVTGVDAVEENINIARIHAAADPVTSSIEYCCTTAEDLVKENKKFDAVISLEVIEHVAGPSDFCKSIAALAAPNGAVVMSTMNRTIKSYATAIVAAEYILKWVPKGTHEWSKFVTPEELTSMLQTASVSVKEVTGLVCNISTGDWSFSDDKSVHYILFGTKESGSDS